MKETGGTSTLKIKQKNSFMNNNYYLVLYVDNYILIFIFINVRVNIHRFLFIYEYCL